jgi:hypothetical protein
MGHELRRKTEGIGKEHRERASQRQPKRSDDSAKAKAPSVTSVGQNASLTEHQTSKNCGHSWNGTNGDTSGPILPLIDEIEIQIL